MNYLEKYEEWCNNHVFDEDTRNELLALKGNDQEIKERFYKDLEFGTGGLRGIIGAGTNRMNIYTVGKATQGLANAILKRMRKYGMSFSDFTVGEENRFIKYVPKKYLSHKENQIMYSNNDFRYYKGGEYLAHYGKKGMKWKKHKASIERHDDAANSFASNSVYKEMAARKALRFGNRSLSTRVRKRTDQDISTNRIAGLKHRRLASANKRAIRSGGMTRTSTVAGSNAVDRLRRMKRRRTHAAS